MNRKTIFTFLVAFFGVSVLAFSQQHLKIGYTNLDYIMNQMPEMKQIESQLKEFEKQLQSQLQSKYTEYEQKLDAYKRGQATMADIVKQDKEQELMNLQNNIREFEEKAQTEMQKKQMSLLQPVLEKIQKSIDKVAEAHGYSYIFSTHSEYGSTAIILYAKSKEDNISDLVLKDLGVTPAPQTQSSTSGGIGTRPTNSSTGTSAPVRK